MDILMDIFLNVIPAVLLVCIPRQGKTYSNMNSIACDEILALV